MKGRLLKIPPFIYFFFTCFVHFRQESAFLRSPLVIGRCRFVPPSPASSPISLSFSPPQAVTCSLSLSVFSNPTLSCETIKRRYLLIPSGATSFCNCPTPALICPDALSLHAISCLEWHSWHPPLGVTQTGIVTRARAHVWLEGRALVPAVGPFVGGSRRLE